MNCVELNGEAVVRCVVGDIDWCRSRLGGTWVEAGDLQPGPGWTYVNGQFRYPQTFPSWTWNGSEWQAPVAAPDPQEGGDWAWDEDAQEWVWAEWPVDS